MCAIETKYGSKGNFNLIIKMLGPVANFTLIEICCKDELGAFIMKFFKLDNVYALGCMTQWVI